MHDEPGVNRAATSVGGECWGALILNFLVSSALTTILSVVFSAGEAGPYGVIGGITLGILGLPLYQLAYLVPLWRRAARAGENEREVGLKRAALITPLAVLGFVVGCRSC